MAHAIHSPSSAKMWLACAAAAACNTVYPDEENEFAADGTLAHALRAHLLDPTNNPAPADDIADEMREVVTASVERVRAVVAAVRGTLLVEQKLPIESITGEPGAKGTSDVVILAPEQGEMIVDDYKHGRGVRVDAEENPQLKIYALAALREFGITGDYERVRVVIDQPRLGHLSEATYTVEELEAFGDEVKAAAARSQAVLDHFKTFGAVPEESFNPGEETCRWCKHKANCPALARQVAIVTGADFEDLTAPDRDVLTNDPGIGGKMHLVPLIEDWCKAVRAEVERRLVQGENVPGWKLVEGRRGARKWVDEARAEAALKAMRLTIEQMYDLSLITPPTAEKLAKAGTIGPRQWPKLQQLIVQGDGKPSVAPESDKRPAITVTAVADDFESLI